MTCSEHLYMSAFIYLSLSFGSLKKTQISSVLSAVHAVNGRAIMTITATATNIFLHFFQSSVSVASQPHGGAAPVVTIARNLTLETSLIIITSLVDYHSGWYHH